MYVTRPLSQLLKSPECIAEQPEGPNSGFLVIQDEESETYSCFGCCKNRTLRELPFPQDKELTVRYVIHTGQSAYVSLNPVFLIPVLNQPLSSNRYYAIDPHGKHKGKAFTCSKEDDKTTCCFCRCIKDVKPKPLDPNNIYQQFEIVISHKYCCTIKGEYSAVSIDQDGFPPYFFRRKGWSIYTKTVDNVKLNVAQGLDSKLRARLPEFDDFSVCQKSSQSYIVGKWYCPFIFVNEGTTLRDQVERSMYYEMTLEQRWDQIFTCTYDDNDEGNFVSMDAIVENQEAFIGDVKALWSEKKDVDGVIWFTSVNDSQTRVGLRAEIVERMKWEQARGGWVEEEEKQVKFDRVEEFKGSGKWSVFGVYVLVERFNLRRMDGSLVMSCDFKHCHHINTKWE